MIIIKYKMNYSLQLQFSQIYNYGTGNIRQNHFNSGTTCRRSTNTTTVISVVQDHTGRTSIFSYLNYQAASHYYVRRCGLLLQTVQRGLSVLSVCLPVTLVCSPTKRLNQLDAVQVDDLGGPRNILDEDPDTPIGRGDFEGEGAFFSGKGGSL